MSVPREETRSPPAVATGLVPAKNTVGIAADHGGYALKQLLIKRLQAAGTEVRDFGDLESVPTDDYPDFVIPLARAVAAGEVRRGVAICGSGVGACVVANKVDGVRAGLLHDTFSAHQGVEDDDLNLICLGGLVIGPSLAWELVQTFLNARFSGEARHRRRLAKIAAQERRTPGQHQRTAEAQASAASPSLQIYVIRHGETEWSVSGQHSGRADIPLTPRGEKEARAVGERLRGIVFSHVLSSPQRRAQQTVALTGLAHPAVIEPDLAEWDTGDDEGRTTEEILASRPGWNLFHDGSPNGESPAQISARADRLITHLRSLAGNVALFSHSHFGRVLAARWIGLPVAQARHLLLNTASVSVLCYEHDRADQPAISLWNAGATEAPPTAARAANQGDCTTPQIAAVLQELAG